MKKLKPPDSLHLQAAEGWLELGVPLGAQEELEKIKPEFRAHPDVANMRWEICAAQQEWEVALELAANLIQLDPENPLAWIRRSYALHELKRTAEARDNLLRVVDRFPISATIRYNLACYECQLGRLDAAKKWLHEAFKLGSPSDTKATALEDPDLEPLRDYIRTTEIAK